MAFTAEDRRKLDALYTSWFGEEGRGGYIDRFEDLLRCTLRLLSWLAQASSQVRYSESSMEYDQCPAAVGVPGAGPTVTRLSARVVAASP